jgi:transposase
MDTKANEKLLLSPADRVRLESWVADRNTPQKLVWRARIVLMWADAASLASIVRTLGETKKTAYRWRDRYRQQGVDGLARDATLLGRKTPLSTEVIARVVEMTLQ